MSNDTEARTTGQPAVAGPVHQPVRPVAEVMCGRLRWHIPSADYRVPEKFLNNDLHPLYDQAALDAAVAAERERWQSRVHEAFKEGFYAPRTYNDTVLNTADEEWEEAKAGLLKA